MSDEQWQAAWKLYQAGSSIPPEQLHAFLNSATGDLQVRAAVLEMFDGAGKADSLDRIGQRIGRYVLTGRLGEGGMGEVYAARDSELGRPVAVKLLAASAASSPVDRFIREAKSASALNHPNIVTIYEVIHTASRFAIVMELVDGMALRQLCGSPLPVDRLLHMGEQIARALAAAHARGIVHCDIKPENLMVRQDGFVKVMDFGLARDITSLTASSIVPAGTLRYMSPEQSRGEMPSSASDIFSLGIVLYELAAGTHPFESGSIFETLKAVNQTQPPAPSSFNPFVPAHLDAVILGMLAKDPNQRPTASEVTKLLDLRRAPAGPMEASSPAALSQPAASLRPAPRRRWVTMALAATAVVILAGFALSRWRPEAVSRAPESRSLEAAPFATELGLKRDPSFSPDGKHMAYSLDTFGRRNNKIYIQPVKGGAALRLTAPPDRAGDYNPTWSPDGNTIAFLRYVGVQRSEVVTIPSKGGAERKIAELRTPQLLDWRGGPYLRWSPDPRWLVISHNRSAEEAFGLFLLSLETGELRPLTSPPNLRRPFGDGAPAFSPDGRTLAFSRLFAEGSSDLYVLPLSKDLQPAAGLRRLQTGQPWNTQPAWTPDGNEIIFCTGTEKNTHLSRISPSSSDGPRVLVGAGESGSYPAISPEREPSLIYIRRLLTGAVWRLGLAHDAEGPLPAKALPIRVIGPGIGTETPTWSPDNKHFAFVSSRTGASEIWVADSDGSNTVQWTNFHWAHISSPQWSADGRRILFRAVQNGRRDTHVVDGPGLAPRPLQATPFENAVWSPDGKWAYFENEQGEVWRAPAAGGAPVQIAEDRGYNLRVSPDSRTLYYAKIRAGQVWIWGLPVQDQSMNLASGILPRPVLAMTNSYAVGKRGLYFVPVSSLGEIAYFDLASGKTHSLIKFDKEVGYQISVSSDERYLLYEQLESEVVELMKVNLFR